MLTWNWLRSSKPATAGLALAMIATLTLSGCGAAKEPPKPATPTVATPGAGAAAHPDMPATPPAAGTTPTATPPSTPATPPAAGTAAVAKDSPLAFVANNAFLTVVVRPARILKSDIVKGLPPEMIAEAIEKFRSQAGAPVDVDPTKVDFIVASVVPEPKKEGEPSFGPPGKGVVVVHTTEPMNADELIGKRKESGAPVTEASKDAQKYYRLADAKDGSELKPEETDVLLWVDSQTLVSGNEVKVLELLAARGSGQIVDRLKGVSLDQDLVVLGYPDNDVKALAGMAAGGQLPPGQGEQVSQALESTKSVLFSLDLTKGNLLGLTIEGTTDEAVAAMEKKVKEGQQQLVGMYPLLTGGFRGDDAPAPEKALAMYGDELLKGLSVEKKGMELTINIKNPGGLDKLMATLKPKIEEAVAKSRAAAENVKRFNSLKQIALGFHNYHDANQSFPPTKDAKGKLSWRVHILPYIDQAPLYSKFNLEEDWDSETNKPLIEQMPKIFASEGEDAEEAAKEGKTRYVGITGEGAPFGREEGGIKIREITDGTSNTIMVVEAGADKAVVWTKPDDLKFDAADPVASFGELKDGKLLVVLMDGAARAISLNDVMADTLKALVTFAGGEIVGEF
jgi:hypothetical protein